MLTQIERGLRAPHHDHYCRLLQVVPFYQDADPTGPGARYRALVLDSSYRPIDVVSWQRAICLDLFDKVGSLRARVRVGAHCAHWHGSLGCQEPAACPGPCVRATHTNSKAPLRPIQASHRALLTDCRDSVLCPHSPGCAGVHGPGTLLSLLSHDTLCPLPHEVHSIAMRSTEPDPHLRNAFR